MAMALVWVTASCTKQNPAKNTGKNCPDGTCSDPQLFCDSDGVITGEPQTCIGVACAPMHFVACDGDSAITCNAAGDNYEIHACADGCLPGGGCNACSPGTNSCASGSIVTCGDDGEPMATKECFWGCVDAPTAHCAYLEPKYLPNVCDSLATDPALMVGSDTIIDPNTDTNCNGGIVPQIGGPDVCVVRYNAIDIPSGVTLRVTTGSGTVERAIAFVSDYEIFIGGTLDISAVGIVSGPGGGWSISGGAATTSNGLGGGGAGFKTAGGSGGTATIDGGAANGGAPFDPATLMPLVGGPRSPSAGGGGAVTLISCRGDTTVMGTIAAGGGGGAGGIMSQGAIAGGDGGGAGGYVVIQGMSVTVTGNVYANGGGGGGGYFSGATVQCNGMDGTQSDSVAAAGCAPGSGAGAGGNGGVGNASPVDGGHPTSSGAAPGGGGGSVGYLQTYTPTGFFPTVTPAHASPPFEPNRNVATR